MNSNNIRAIFFDADDTIVDHKECERQALLFLFNKIGKEYKEQYQSIFRPLDRQLWDSAEHGLNTISKKDIPEYRFKEFFKRIDLNYNDYRKENELFKEGLAKSTALTENAYEIMQYLYFNNYKLYVVTNGIVELQRPRIRNSKISKFISDIIVSEEVSSCKPNPKIFRVLLDKINMKSSEVIMIGDSLEKDIQGAKNADIKAIWYNPNNKINKTKIEPHYQITNLIQLKEIL